MAPLALYARRFPPERFTLLAGIQMAIGTVGTLFVTAPLAWASAAIGWRGWLLFAGVVLALTLPWYGAVCSRLPEFGGYFFWTLSLFAMALLLAAYHAKPPRDPLLYGTRSR